jgi:hypothetical protein
MGRDARNSSPPHRLRHPDPRQPLEQHRRAQRRDVRAAATIPYAAVGTYHFRLIINVPAHTYSIFVTPPGGTEQTVGSNFAFRTEQNAVTSLDSWGVIVNKVGTSLTNRTCPFWVYP